MSFDNLASLIYLKNKLHKWKNIAILLAIFSLLLTLRFMFGGGLSSDSIAAGDYIANIKIDNVIVENDFRSKILKKIAEESSIKAVIVNIDSPGGGIVGSEILFNDLRKIAIKKPMVVLMGSLAASGGYMAAVAADHIIAHNGTLTGSIGVLMESPNAKELADKIGFKFNTYKSSPLKGSPSLFEKSNPEVDRAIKGAIDDSYQFFIQLIEARRGNKINKKFKEIAFDGRVFTGRQALIVGLVDEIGSKDNALLYLEKNKVDVKNLPVKDVKIIEEEKKFFDKITSKLPFFHEVNSFSGNGAIMAIMK